MSRGAIVASDLNLEWLLPWWWSHFHFHNKQLPIAFIDLGMSAKAKIWCQERGCLLALDTLAFAAPKKEISPARIRLWEKRYGQGTWKARPAWFLKPFAMLRSPFQETLWLDLDCEALKPLDPIFENLQSKEIGLARENRGATYNSGVVVFRKESPLLKRWAELCRAQNARFIGDQQVFSYLVKKQQGGFIELPAECNWMAGRGFNPNAFVMHWSNQWGKMFIELYGGAQGFLSSLQ